VVNTGSDQHRRASGEPQTRQESSFAGAQTSSQYSVVDPRFSSGTVAAEVTTTAVMAGQEQLTPGSYHPHHQPSAQQLHPSHHGLGGGGGQEGAAVYGDTAFGKPAPHQLGQTTNPAAGQISNPQDAGTATVLPAPYPGGAPPGDAEVAKPPQHGSQQVSSRGPPLNLQQPPPVNALATNPAANAWLGSSASEELPGVGRSGAPQNTWDQQRHSMPVSTPESLLQQNPPPTLQQYQQPQTTDSDVAGTGAATAMEQEQQNRRHTTGLQRQYTFNEQQQHRASAPVSVAGAAAGMMGDVPPAVGSTAQVPPADPSSAQQQQHQYHPQRPHMKSNESQNSKTTTSPTPSLTGRSVRIAGAAQQQNMKP